eukprot:4652885-Prymnesium_polylepis.1
MGGEEHTPPRLVLRTASRACRAPSPVDKREWTTRAATTTVIARTAARARASPSRARSNKSDQRRSGPSAH